jgi:CubicO group peptidase (beta-lactamase class C family)
MKHAFAFPASEEPVMMIMQSVSDVTFKGSAPPRGGLRSPAHVVLVALVAGALSSVTMRETGWAQPAPSGPAMEARVQALIPELETYIANSMKAFDVPGLAIGIVTGDRLVYAKGFGVRSKAGGAAVDTRTVFQIGSLAKAFLATTMAIAVDRGQLRWDDRVVDLHPAFQLKDPWVTREFRAFDLLAQRSGLPPYVNDMLALLGYDEAALIRSLRHVEPVSSFRTTFAYLNIPHLLAGRIVAGLQGAPDWNAVARGELLDPLGMTETTFTAEAIKAAPNHADGYRWTPDKTIAVPFEPFFPYGLGPAGNINSTLDDMTRWLRLQLKQGTFEGRRIVAPESLAYARTPKVAINDKLSYAMGWLVAQTPNGTLIWHDGGTAGFGAFMGMQLDRDVGVIVLSNAKNVGMPDALGLWIFDRLLDNPMVDHVADTLKAVKAKFVSAEKVFAKPEKPRPFPALAPLAGNFASATFGKAILRPREGALVLELAATGAELALEPWDGDVFTVRLLPRGRFASVLETMDDRPDSFAQFETDKEGRLGVLRFTFDDGQAYDFRRE